MMKDDDFKLLQGFADGQTDRRTNEQTFVIVELLLRLKIQRAKSKKMLLDTRGLILDFGFLHQDIGYMQYIRTFL